MLSNDALPILIIDDSDEDFDMLKLTFSRYGISNRIFRCEQGEDVIPLLNEMANSAAGLPGIIMLDLNLIGLDGREVLKRIKSNNIFKRIPVVVLSTSSSHKDIETCYLEGASSYTVKPVNLERFEKFVSLFKQYWLESSILPRQSALENARKNG